MLDLESLPQTKRPRIESGRIPDFYRTLSDISSLLSFIILNSSLE